MSKINQDASIVLPKSRSFELLAALSKPFRWLLVGIKSLFLILLLAWGSLAIYYNLPWESMRLAVALVFLTVGIWALWYSRTWRAISIFAALFLGVVVWFSSIKPSNTRHWRPEVAVMSRAIIDTEAICITGQSNFEYRRH